MKLLLAAIRIAVAVLCMSGWADAQAGVEEYKFGNYTFKLMANGQMGQMMQGLKIVGSIYTVNGKQDVLPIVPEPEATAVKKAFADWKARASAGSTAPPAASVSFEPDGSAMVPMPGGTLIHFTPTYVEVTQSNVMASLPGQLPMNVTKFVLTSPNILKMAAKGSTGIFVNGTEQTPRNTGPFINGGGRKAQKLNNYYRPMVDGPVTEAAQRAASDPKKPSNALDYLDEVKRCRKRVDESF